MQLNPNSIKKLSGVHPDLVRVVKRAATMVDADGVTFIVTCGVRTLVEQKKLVAGGFSKTLNSRHIPAPRNNLSHAVDMAVTVGSTITWQAPAYKKLAKIMKEAAKIENVQIEWGGDWVKFFDGPHFQLPFASYPK
jgi:peptidoglycan L-alanyl-D-glutamate endopeptidase CwlK